MPHSSSVISGASISLKASDIKKKNFRRMYTSNSNFRQSKNELLGIVKEARKEDSEQHSSSSRLTDSDGDSILEKDSE